MYRLGNIDQWCSIFLYSNVVTKIHKPKHAGWLCNDIAYVTNVSML